MKVQTSRPIHLLSLSAFVSLSFLAVACDNGTPAFTENVIGSHSVQGNYPGQDAVADDPDENYVANPVDDSTPADRGEVNPGAAAPTLTSWTFKASTMEAGTVSYRPLSKIALQDITMDKNVIASEKVFTQMDRPMLTELFTQGSELKKQSEIFKQNSSAQGALDLLLVVDNSGSMKEEQENLSNKLSPLLSYVKDSDWRIGVVTTDPNEGCLRALISKSDANSSQAFAAAVQAGIKGSGNERGILQAVNGLKGECNPNGSWLRPQSTVAVLIVSDEDNCSAGKDCGTDPWASGSYLTNYLSSIRQPGINARVYGLIGHPTLTSSQCSTMAAKAHIYASVIADTAGSWGSICSSDYSGTLQAISKDISALLMTQFTLQYKPVAETVKVYLDGALQTSGYAIHNNVVEFASAPKAGAIVSFDYEFTAEAPKSEFPIREKVAQASMKVYLDGVESTAFSFDPLTQSLKFASAPKAKSIKAVYRRGDDLPKAFQMDKGIALANIKVSVSGQVLASTAYAYNADSGVLTFKTAPSDKAPIVINADKIMAHALSYPLHIGAAQLSAYDHENGQALKAQFHDGLATFSQADYSPGRKVFVKGVTNASWFVPLAETVLAEGMTITSASGACQSFAFINGGVDLSSCGFKSGEEVRLAFLYEKERREIFDLVMLDDFSLEERAKWTVKVNGVESKDFKIVSGRLHMPNLPMQAVIEVSMENAPIM